METVKDKLTYFNNVRDNLLIFTIYEYIEGERGESER